MNQETKRIETLEEKSLRYKNSFNPSNGTEAEDFKNGANWQKEQDKVIIQDLFEIVGDYDRDMNGKAMEGRLNPNGIEYHKRIKKIIQTTENYLK